MILPRSHMNTAPNRSNNTCTPCLCQNWHDPNASSPRVTAFINTKRWVLGKPGSCSVCSHTVNPTHPSELGQSWQLLRDPKQWYKCYFRKSVWKRLQMYFIWHSNKEFVSRPDCQVPLPQPRDKAPSSWPVVKSALVAGCLFFFHICSHNSKEHSLSYILALSFISI